MEPIALDHKKTWPDQLVNVLHEGFEVLRCYEDEDRLRQEAIDADRSLKYEPWLNPLANDRDEILRNVRSVVQRYSLLGYHCTRLTFAEIADVQIAGMQPLSSELVSRRIEQAVSSGELDPRLGTTLTQENLADKSYRKGMIWWIFSEALLRKESGIYRLLTFWGGEAVYAHHEDDTTVSKALAHIGTACIIKASIPISSLSKHATPELLLANNYLERRGVTTEGRGLGSEYVVDPLPASRVQQVIKASESEFECLTGHSSWFERLT